MSTEQRENLDAILRQSALPFDSDVSELRRLTREYASAQPLPPGVNVTAGALGGVPTAEITIDGIEPRQIGRELLVAPMVGGDLLHVVGHLAFQCAAVILL